MATLFDWSATPGSNTSVNGVNIAEGMSPALVNDAMRSIMALVRNSFASGLQTFLAGSAGLGLANGGTGGTDQATALAALGALSSIYRDLPFIGKSAAFNIDNTERSSGINYIGSAAAATIRPQSAHSVNVVAVFRIRNGGSGALTFTRGSGVSLFANGSTTSADAVLAVGGEVTLEYWGSDVWMIFGPGLS